MGRKSKASSMSKRSARAPDYNACMNGKKETFAMVYDSMLKHPRFIQLSPTAKNVYVSCRNQATCLEGRRCLYNHAKRTGETYPEYCFVFPAKQQVQYGYKDRANVTKYMQELIDAGFIEIYEQNKHRFKLNVYRFTSGWKEEQNS